MWYTDDIEYVEALMREVDDWDKHKIRIIVSIICRIAVGWAFLSLLELDFEEIFKLNADTQMAVTTAILGGSFGCFFSFMFFHIGVFPYPSLKFRLIKLLILRFDANPKPENKVGNKTGVGINLITSRCSNANLNDLEFVNLQRKSLRIGKMFGTCYYIIIAPMLIYLFWLFGKGILVFLSLCLENEIPFFTGLGLGIVFGYLVALSCHQFMWNLIYPLFACYRQERLLILHFDKALSETF